MIVIAQNRSRLRSFRRTKRLISAVLPSISNRVNLGDVPRRVLVELVRVLRANTKKGTSVKLFVAANDGFCGFKCYEFGPKTANLADFVHADAGFDLDLMSVGLLPSPVRREEISRANPDEQR